MTGHNDHRRLHLAVAHGQLDDVVFFQAQLLSVAPETIAALSQLRLVTGLGSSCSQPTFDQRPS
jgi:hypothetical protein